MLSFIFSIFLSVISGIYAGLVVARFIKFEEVRKNIKRIIHDVQIIHDLQEDDYFLLDRGDYTQLTLCIGELQVSNHDEAAEKVNMLFTQLSGFERLKSNKNRSDIETLKAQLVSIPENIAPNIWVLISVKLAI
ncbi:MULTISPECIES: hypothetical protein [Vibrio]|uniref:hypothetical protein n=1 Tax=Vibrio TaxID=662 RepID=UPI000893B588|nr:MULTISPECIES: hypothetical protein [Vibrio]OFJ25189.1 hypothetical protein BFX31_14545 [Vibrio paracholerae]TXX46440.1 hypothetical protein FXF14_14960 [Vibrio cholerae]TYA08208.1 hypothetical protein FXE34_08455 [Vibrio cholerae]WOQ99226.1 hypothetical protein R4537_01530 [Vibrio paracholerae]